MSVGAVNFFLQTVRAAYLATTAICQFPWEFTLGYTVAHIFLFLVVGYIEAAVIPAGARRIRVMEDKPGHSFLGKERKSEKRRDLVEA